MIEIRNSEHLQRWLLESGHLARLCDQPRFFFDSEEYDRELAGVRAQYPRFTAAEAEARTAIRLLGKEEAQSRQPVPAKPMVTLAPSSTDGWSKRERGLHFFLLALIVALLALLCAKPAHGQDLPPALHIERASFRTALIHGEAAFTMPDPDQPNGIIIQVANGGTVLHTSPAGILQFNCSTNLSCSFTAGSGANPPTFTLTATGGSGSGCIPPGTTANALLFDAGSGTCSDVSKFTWNNGTSTLALASGGIFDPTAGTMKVPGTNGQLLFNNSGALGAEDPIVSGPDARGAAQSKNPVAGLAGIDYGSGCSGGPCVQEAKVDSSGNLYIGNFPATQPVSGTVIANQGSPNSNANGWPVALTDLTNVLGTSSHPVRVDPTGTTTQPVSGTVTANQGGSNWSINVAQWAGSNLGAMANYGTSPGAVLVPGVNAYITNTVPVSGTFWQTTQPVSCTAANCAINLQQLNGTTIAVGNGTSGNGNARVNIASDNTAIANWGQGAIGSAVPSGAVYDGGNGSGNLTGRLMGDSYAYYDASTNGTTQIVALSSGKTIYVLGYNIATSQTTAVHVWLSYGTGSNCATGTTQMTPKWNLQAASSTGPIGKVAMTPGWSGLKTAAGNALCISTDAAASVQVELWYTQF